MVATEEDVFTASMNRMENEILPLLSSYPPSAPKSDDSGVLAGSMDLVLYRNLAYSLDFCFNDQPRNGLNAEQVTELSHFVRTRVLPAYIGYFNEHFGKENDKSFYFFVRQESNACWAKLIWLRIKQIYIAKLEGKDTDSHALGVRMPADLMDAFARLMDLFFPSDPSRFEMLGFDLRTDDFAVLEAILQGALVERADPLSSKNAFYILNRVIGFSRNALGSSGSQSENSFIWTSPQSPIIKAWEQWIVTFAAVQESQVHLVEPLLPVLKAMLLADVNCLSFSWWRVLVQKGLVNDSIPIRRVLMMAILSLDPRQVTQLCTPDGLDFCLGDFLELGVDPNSSFFVSAQGGVDLGESLCLFFGQLIEAFAERSSGHGRAIMKELLAAAEETLRVPVGLIYVLKAFTCVKAPFPAVDDEVLKCMSRISKMPSLHNQRARLLVKWQLCEVLMAFAEPAGISFVQLAETFNDLVLEGVSLGVTHSDSENYGRLCAWLNACFGSTFLRENMIIQLQRFFSDAAVDASSVQVLKSKARILATMAGFSLGAEDGRFVAFSRVIFEQMALVSISEQPSEAVPAFIIFLAVNETTQAILRGSDDLIAQLNLTNKIFEWLGFLEGALFGKEAVLSCKVDFISSQVLLEALCLLINRASDNDQGQLMQFLDMLSFRLLQYVERKAENQRDRESDEQVEVGFSGLLTLHAALIALSGCLDKLKAEGHVRNSIVSADGVQRCIRYKLERPAGLSEEEWDLWPQFVTAFTEAKWRAVESMAVNVATSPGQEISLISVLASCVQATEVSKYGGTLAILKCTGTVIDLILGGSGKNRRQNLVLRFLEIDPAFDALFDRFVQVMMGVLKGQSETQRWFDYYADAFIKVAFRQSILEASVQRQELTETLLETFTFFCQEVGPKRRGIVALMSSKLGGFFLGNKQQGLEALKQHWTGPLLTLLLYGPVRGSVEEAVAAKIAHEHVPDSDYQVRVHAITVLNHLKDDALLKDLLMDLIGRQEATASPALRKKMFPGDANHRIRLRTWAGILLLIGILLHHKSVDESYARDELIPMLWRFVGEETMDSTRVYMEWSLGLVYLKFPSLITEDLISQRMSNWIGGFSCQIVSALSVALLIAKKSPDSVPQKMIDYLLPLLAHNNHHVRMRAIHAFKVLYYRSLASSSVLGYKLLAGSIESTEHCRKFIQKVDEDLVTSADGLDPIDDFNLDYIFGRLMRHGGVDGEAIEYYAFMNYYEADGTVPFCNAKESRKEKSANSSSSTQKSSEPAVNIEQLFNDFQQKIDIYSPNMDARMGSCSSRVDLDTEIIVVGSLVDKLPNLAGLARTCEIFGVKRLMVPSSPAELASPDFVNVAMTAERWLDITQLLPENVPKFLEELKKQDGFKIVALEQTANSVPLQSYSFAKKTCLVLGNERTGVPAEILHLVDDCVEIPQFGRVRSLNVHVSGSIAIWKAREQDLI